MIILRLEEIEDPMVRDNFQRLQRSLGEFAILKGKWRFIDLTFTAAVTDYRYPHGLGFIPKDVIQTRLTGAGSLTWNYDDFTRDYIYITTTDACRVRAFVGSYYEGNNS